MYRTCLWRFSVIQVIEAVIRKSHWLLNILPPLPWKSDTILLWTPQDTKGGSLGGGSPLRLNISSINSATYNIAKYLATILVPLMGYTNLKLSPDETDVFQRPFTLHLHTHKWGIGTIRKPSTSYTPEPTSHQTEFARCYTFAWPPLFSSTMTYSVKKVWIPQCQLSSPTSTRRKEVENLWAPSEGQLLATSLGMWMILGSKSKPKKWMLSLYTLTQWTRT